MVRQSGIIKKATEKITALYVRLSRDDDNEGDSNSISHQIEILKKYCRDHGITNYKIYKDDGYSGTSFQRPGFLEMLTDIEAGLVGTVIVKDMSRFGRNYLEVGLYTEIRFPEMGVHFIAVNDGVDSEDEGNDFTPFRNIINEWYAKDTSKKIRAVFRSKGMQGKRMSGKPPYGYFNGPDGHLIVDEETAPIVKLIYQLCVEGNGPGKIARILTERKIPTPSTTIFQRTGQTQFYHPEDPFFWTSSTVSHILEKDVYIGRTTNFKTYKLSYKSKKQIENPPEKKYTGIARALIAYAAKASIDAGFGGVLFFKAKTDELRKYYMQEFGAMPVGRYDPYRLVIWEDAAANILSDFEEV